MDSGINYVVRKSPVKELLMSMHIAMASPFRTIMDEVL